MPKVSILIPIYNVESYLQQCLESIVNQTLLDIEIICINDGSTDDSLKILQAYQAKDSRIKIIDKANSGYGASMNIGLLNATAEYVGIVEPDDFVKIEMFEELYKLAQKNDADIVKSDYYEYDTGKNSSRKSGRISGLLANRLINAKKEPEILKIMPSIWSAIYKRDFLIQNDIKFLETAGASYQDTSFAFKALSLAEKIVFTANAYLYYRTDNENSSVKSVEKVFAICDEYAEITEFLNKNPEIKQFANDIKLIKEYAAYIWSAKRIDEKYLESFVDKFSEIFRVYFSNNELNKNFYKRYTHKEIELLLNNKEKFIKRLEKLREKEGQKQNRRKMFSVRINTSRVSIVVAGKEIVRIG